MQFSKPVIAAVSGYCVAGGLELSLLADLRVVEKSATFGVFCRRFGEFINVGFQKFSSLAISHTKLL